MFLASLGGGLVDGDRIDVDVDVGRGAFALVGTQASTKVYRSPRGCSQHLAARLAEGAFLALVPDPVVCFAGARYEQRTDVALALGASVLVLDGYTCGRSARGERWAFSRYAARTTIARDGVAAAIDATLLPALPPPPPALARTTSGRGGRPTPRHRGRASRRRRRVRPANRRGTFRGSVATFAVEFRRARTSAR